MQGIECVEELAPKVREVLSRQLKVVVIGWRASNHNPLTKQVARTSQVKFLEAGTRQFPRKVGVFLTTRFVNHSDTDRAEKLRVPIYTLSIGAIKEILALCKDLLLPEHKEKTTQKEEPVSEPKNRNTSQMSRRKGFTISQEQRQSFVSAFLDEVRGDPGKALSTVKARQILAVVFDVTERDDLSTYLHRFVRSDLLVGVIADGGERIGSYRLGDTGLEISTAPEKGSFDDMGTLEKLQALIGGEEELLTQKSAIDEKLTKIAKAREVLQELEKIFN